MGELDGIVFAVNSELDLLQVKRVAVHDLHRSVNNRLPDAARELVHPSPLLVYTEITEGFQGVRMGLLD